MENSRIPGQRGERERLRCSTYNRDGGRMPAPSAIEEQQTIQLLRELVRTNSYNPPGREDAVARIVAERAQAWGLRAELVPLAEGRSNLVVSLPEEADGPTLLFCGHLDTVPPGDQPWAHEPLSADLVD